jgi:hypothetical protein
VLGSLVARLRRGGPPDATRGGPDEAGLTIADAYTYLPSSVRRFPGPAELAGELERAGLIEISYLLTAGGMVAIHAGTVPGRGDR